MYLALMTSGCNTEDKKQSHSKWFHNDFTIEKHTFWVLGSSYRTTGKILTDCKRSRLCIYWKMQKKQQRMNSIFCFVFDYNEYKRKCKERASAIDGHKFIDPVLQRFILQWKLFFLLLFILLAPKWLLIGNFYAFHESFRNASLDCVCFFLTCISLETTTASTVVSYRGENTGFLFS